MQASAGSASECARRLQLQLPGGREAEAGEAGEWGESFNNHLFQFGLVWFGLVW